MENFLSFLDRHAVSIIITLAICAVLFIMVGHKYKDYTQSILQRPFVILPETKLDMWSVSHTFLYAIFGFILPNRPILFLLLGASFELFEDCLSSDSKTQLTDCTTCDKDAKFMCSTSINDGYWYAKWDDIFINLLGYVVGSSIRTTLV